VPILASHFLHAICRRRFGREPLRLTRADVGRLQAYDWPGNVRELENVLERAVIISRGNQLHLELPAVATATVRTPAAAPIGDDGFLTERERRERDRALIARALAQCDGKVFGPGGAAELLGVKPTTLASRIKRWGIRRPTD
jgi:formate hydrogenlyase transcriptional activator